MALNDIEKNQLEGLIIEIDDATTELQNCELHLAYSIGSLLLNKDNKDARPDSHCISKHLLGAKGVLMQSSEMAFSLNEVEDGNMLAECVVACYMLVQANRQAKTPETLRVILDQVRQLRRKTMELTAKYSEKFYGGKTNDA